MSLKILVPLSLFLLILQCVIFPTIMPRNIKPDLLLLLVINIGLYENQERTLLSGFFLGLLQDAFASVPMGAFTLAKMLAGLIVRAISGPLMPENRLVQLVCIASGLTVQNAVLFVILVVFRSRELTLEGLSTILGIEALLTVIAAAPLFYYLNRLRARRRVRHDWKEL